MKIKTDRPQPAFEPRSITFTFETQEELDAMFSLFNWTPICELHPSLKEVWRKLDSLGSKTSENSQEKILRNRGLRGEIISLAEEYTKE